MNEKRMKTWSNTKGQPVASTTGWQGSVNPGGFTKTSGFTVQKRNKPSLSIMNVQTPGGDQLQFHAHGSGKWHQTPVGVPRERGDQAPLSPRTQRKLDLLF